MGTHGGGGTAARHNHIGKHRKVTGKLKVPDDVEGQQLRGDISDRIRKEANKGSGRRING